MSETTIAQVEALRSSFMGVMERRDALGLGPLTTEAIGTLEPSEFVLLVFGSAELVETYLRDRVASGLSVEEVIRLLATTLYAALRDGLLDDEAGVIVTTVLLVQMVNVRLMRAMDDTP